MCVSVEREEENVAVTCTLKFIREQVMVIFCELCTETILEKVEEYGERVDVVKFFAQQIDKMMK